MSSITFLATATAPTTTPGGSTTYPPAQAPADRNANGIPDQWETARGLDPATCKATGRDLDPRYDNLEVYLNSL